MFLCVILAGFFFWNSVPYSYSTRRYNKYSTGSYVPLCTGTYRYVRTGTIRSPYTALYEYGRTVLSSQYWITSTRTGIAMTIQYIEYKYDEYHRYPLRSYCQYKYSTSTLRITYWVYLYRYIYPYIPGMERVVSRQYRLPVLSTY